MNVKQKQKINEHFDCVCLKWKTNSFNEMKEIQQMARVAIVSSRTALLEYIIITYSVHASGRHDKT